MRCRLALIVALLSPVATLAQTAGTVSITPGTFGRTACGSADTVTISWTSSYAITLDDKYRLFVAQTSCTTGTPAQWGSDIDAMLATQSFTTTKQDLLAQAGVTCPTTGNATIYVCVQHWQISGTATNKGTASGTAKYEGLLPAVPASVTVVPGDSSLFVSWTDPGTSDTKAASFTVTAVGSTGTHTQGFASATGEHRVSGLTNGVTYAVTVTSVSAGGNPSAASDPVAGTPQLVNGFWEQYKADGGVEQGGCGGGPAGLVALLGVALALGGLRRRS